MVGSIILFILVVVAIFPSWFAHDNPAAEIYKPAAGTLVVPPAGYDLVRTGCLLAVDFWRAPIGVIALIVGAFCTVVSVAVGVTAAYSGGSVDDTLSLFTDVILVIPTFPLIIVITAYAKGASFWLIVAVLVFTGWSYGARQLRVQALSLRNRDYLLAAKARGEASWYVITVELIPPMTSLIVANFLSAALYAVLASAALQFIGLGNINTESWGTMLYWAQNNEALQTGLPLWALAPGVAIALLGSALALLNYAFDEVSNPALRPVSEKKMRKRMKKLEVVA